MSFFLTFFTPTQIRRFALAVSRPLLQETQCPVDQGVRMAVAV